MAKRNLNRRQKWRIEKVQQERLARAERRQQQQLESLDSEAIGEERSGRVISNYGATVELHDGQGETHRCALRQNLGPLVVGDRVIWQPSGDHTGVVTALAPRQTLLSRPDRHNVSRPLAANIDQIVIVTAPQPAYSTDLIDQYLVAAELNAIKPIILLNKIDLIEPQQRQSVVSVLQLYQQLGYPLHSSSTIELHGLEQLNQVLSGHSSVFVGQSGVGKSSLINALLPAAEIPTQALSDHSGLGQHTTSASRLYSLDSGGELIDSPGVREFRLWKIEQQELSEGFVEFRPYLGHCRFRNCRHTNEPGCALREALTKGQITEQRLESFYRIRDTLVELS